MQCEDAIEQIASGGATPGANLKAAMEHAARCDDCHAALRALDALRPLRDEPAPIPTDGAIERAVDKAIASEPSQRYRRGFWSGLASGGAIAATLAALAVTIWLQSRDDGLTGAVPQVRVALNQPSPLTMTLESPEALAGAEVRVELRGAVTLEGYAGQRELRWMTDLDRGVNQLTLPVVALDASGGQVVVEVMHGDKRRTFIVDVRGSAAG